MLTKRHPERDNKYLQWIKLLNCLLCGRESEPHHINEKGNGGKGTKASDLRCIPLCHEHHMELHNKGRDTFATKYIMDYEEVIRRLNGIYASMD